MSEPQAADLCGDACHAARAEPSPRDADWVHTARWAKALAWASLAWMTAEGGAGFAAGLTSGSTALVGWALSSVVEGLASIIVIWRFTGARTLSETAEGRARKAVAISFWLLAPYIAIEAVIELASARHPDPSALGIAVTALSLAIMPGLGIAKRRLGARLGSGATAGEGTQNLLCAYLAAPVLVGLAANTVTGAWWLDPIIALAVAATAVREGTTSWRGDDCC